MTLHPDGKTGVKISKEKYDQIKTFILSILNKREIISYQELSRLATENLNDTFDGSVPWYLVTVKLDLEARHIIKRTKDKGPHKLVLSF